MATALALSRGGRSPVPSVVFGTLVFVVTEVMFFLALVSAMIVIKGGPGAWAPPPGVRLPVATTAVNTAILLWSGALAAVSLRRLGQGRGSEARSALGRAALLGAVFVAVQGFEWLRLVGYGSSPGARATMTMGTGVFSACFFLVIGLHGLHAAAAVGVLAWAWRRLAEGELGPDAHRATLIFWLFVVVIWPPLYGLVYF